MDWGIQFESGFRATSDDFRHAALLRKWLLSCECGLRGDRRAALWPHIWVQVLGVSIGIGLFVSRRSVKS